jgi:hypothetical protein
VKDLIDQEIASLSLPPIVVIREMPFWLLPAEQPEWCLLAHRGPGCSVERSATFLFHMPLQRGKALLVHQVLNCKKRALRPKARSGYRPSRLKTNYEVVIIAWLPVCNHIS